MADEPINVRPGTWPDRPRVKCVLDGCSNLLLKRDPELPIRDSEEHERLQWCSHEHRAEWEAALAAAPPQEGGGGWHYDFATSGPDAGVVRTGGYGSTRVAQVFKGENASPEEWAEFKRWLLHKAIGVPRYEPAAPTPPPAGVRVDREALERAVVQALHRCDPEHCDLPHTGRCEYLDNAKHAATHITAALASLLGSPGAGA